MTICDDYKMYIQSDEVAKVFENRHVVINHQCFRVHCLNHAFKKRMK